MAIFRLQHAGTAVADYERVTSGLARLGLPTRDFRDDQGKGFQHDSRVLLGNDCWLHVVYNWNPESRVNRYLSRFGEGLEHLALESDDIEADVARVRDLGVPIFEDTIFDANDGYEAFVFPDDGIGFTVELIQPHVKSWAYPEEARGERVSPVLGVSRAKGVTASVSDVDEAARRFEALFGIAAVDGVIPLGNVELTLVETSERPHLTSLTLATETLDADLEYLRSVKAPFVGDQAFDAGFGFPIELSAA